MAAAAFPMASTRMFGNWRRSNSHSPTRQMDPERSTAARTVSATSIAASVSRKIPRAMAFRSDIALNRFKAALRVGLGAASGAKRFGTGERHFQVLVLRAVAHANGAHYLVGEHQRKAAANRRLLRAAANGQAQREHDVG